MTARQAPTCESMLDPCEHSAYVADTGYAVRRTPSHPVEVVSVPGGHDSVLAAYALGYTVLARLALGRCIVCRVEWTAEFEVDW